MPITTLDGTRRLLLSPSSLCLSVSLLPLTPLTGRFIGSSVHRSRLHILLSNYTVTCNRSCQLAALFSRPECNPFFRKGPRVGFRFDFFPFFSRSSFQRFRSARGVVFWFFSFGRDFFDGSRKREERAKFNSRSIRIEKLRSKIFSPRTNKNDVFRFQRFLMRGYCCFRCTRTVRKYVRQID